MTKDQAARTAGESLQHIENWTKRTCIACIVAATTTTITSLVGLGATYQYWRISSAVSEATAGLDARFSKALAAGQAQRKINDAKLAEFQRELRSNTGDQ